MKPSNTIPLVLTLFAIGVQLVDARHVNLTTRRSGTPDKTSDKLEIEEGEVAKVVSYLGSGRLTVQIPRLSSYDKVLDSTGGSPNFWSPTTEPVIVAGPARILLSAPSQDDEALCTEKITPECFPPGETLVIPAGTKTAKVTLESRSDLKHWEPTEPGTFGDVEENLFFRIRAEGVD